MQKKRTHITLRIFLLALFLSYYGNITFFPHYHIVDGIRIVHSHFHKTTTNHQPQHSHSGNEIKLIAHLNYFFTLLLLAPSVSTAPLTRKLVLYITRKAEVPASRFFFHKKLRAPRSVSDIFVNLF